MNVGIVVPVLNESKRIESVLEDLKVKQPDYNIFLVDDGSTDSTMEVVKKIHGKITTLRHKINLGKGAALKTGCEAAIRKGMDIVVFMDGDGQHKPEDISLMIKKMQNENLDIVFGSRTIGKDMPIVMMLGNKFLSIMTGLLFGIYISDTQSGFRAFRTRVYKKIVWNSTRYSAETEMIVNAGKYKLRFGDVQIKTIYLDDYKGTTVLDGIRIFCNMLIWRII